MKITVAKRGKRFTVSFSKLPGKTFGPWDLAEMVRDLRISALLTPLQARELVMDAAIKGSASIEVAES